MAELLIFFLCFNYFFIKRQKFINVNLITLFCKWKDIKCFIYVFLTIGILNYRRSILVFCMFSLLFTIIIIGLSSFWYFLIRFISSVWKFWHFSQWRNIICTWVHHVICDIPSTLYLWCHNYKLLWLNNLLPWFYRQGRISSSTLWWKANMCYFNIICIN